MTDWKDSHADMIRLAQEMVKATGEEDMSSNTMIPKEVDWILAGSWRAGNELKEAFDAAFEEYQRLDRDTLYATG